MKFKKISELSDEEKERIIKRNLPELDIKSVERIVENVRKKGDKALRYYTKKFDGIAIENFRVSDEEFEEAFEKADKSIIEAIIKAHDNIKKFHEEEKKNFFKDWFFVNNGIKAGQIFRAIESAGCYIPGGKAAYPSTALMLITPARIAGVKKVICVTPPDKKGKANPYTLIACKIAGADEVYKIGGAHAIAALAFGTESVPKVDKIFGPGNIFVTSAKKKIFGYAGIDLLAGPSEILIIADETADARFIAADMLAQLEHGNDSEAVLLTTSRKIAEEVNRILEKEKGNYYILLGTLDECIDFANSYAPEHLEIITENKYEVLEKIESAGSIFLGNYSPVAAGDYASGTNHVLPTSATARFSSALSVKDFLKVIQFQEISEKSFERIAGVIIKIAEAEGLKKHAESIKIRAEKGERAKENKAKNNSK